MISNKKLHLYCALVFFFAAMMLYINIDKIPLTHPGNIKAADPFYHALISEGIINTGQWDHYDTVFSLGTERASNSQPPLFYIASALLTLYSGVPVWSTLYLLICISQALLVIITYLLSKEIFDNENIALLASGLCILPLPVHVWLYGLYIGLWLQVSSNFFMLTAVWLAVRYFKRKEDFTLFFIGICITAIMLLHPQDLGMVSIPALAVAIRIILDNKRDVKAIIKKGTIMGLVPVILFLVLLPKFIFVWGAQGSNLYNFGFYGIRSNYYSREYSGGLVFPDLLFMHWLALLAFAAGLIQLFLNRKRYLPWLYATVIFFTLMYVLPIFVKDPYYFVRARSLTPFFIIPTAAYFIQSSIISGIEKRSNFPGIVYVLAIILVGVAAAMPQYYNLAKGMAYEHINEDEWKAYTWLHSNTPEDSKILFFGGIFQSENIYSRRISASFTLNVYQELINEYLRTNITPERVYVDWGGETVRSVHKYQISFLDYGDFPEPDRNASIYDFDYIFFQDISQELANANHFFINEFVTKKGFIPVYNDRGYIIIKNENKK